MIYYITGGERSGKSSYAQSLAESLSKKPIYLATSRVWDVNFEKRIERHQNDRNDSWKTIEEEKNISNVITTNSTTVIDCVTLWLTNLCVDSEYNIEKCLSFAKQEIDKLSKIDANIIIISNEIGMGLHAHTEAGRKFTELQGWTNQYIAKKADKAIFMVSGLPMTLK